MYPAIKSNAVTEAEAIKIVGKDVIEELLGMECEFTGRVIDEVYGVQEMSARTETDTHVIEVLYTITDADCELEDIGDADYSNYTFEIWEK